MDTVAQGWTNVRPEEDGQRFTQRSAERRQLFLQLKSLHHRTDLPSITWAFFQIADIEVIREVVQGRFSWRYFADDEHRLAVERKALDTIRLWSQKDLAKNLTAASAKPAHSQPHTVSNQPSSRSRPPSASVHAGYKRTRSRHITGSQGHSVKRHDSVKSSCRERDGELCVVTQTAEIDAAHIYPWCAFGEKDEERVANFWNTLKMFWNEDLVESWRSKFVDANHPNRGKETVENMISLTATMHRFHTVARFALRPIQLSDDKKQLELEFHWLVVEKRNRHDAVDIMDEPLSSAGRRSAGRGYGPSIGRIPTTIPLPALH